jgi:hypothetical protein
MRSNSERMTKDFWVHEALMDCKQLKDKITASNETSGELNYKILQPSRITKAFLIKNRTSS